MRSKITSNTKTTQEVAITLASSGAHHGTDTAVQQQVGHLRTLADNRIKSTAASNNNDAVYDPKSSQPGSSILETPRPKRKIDGIFFDYFPTSDLKRPLILSSSGSSSAASSPGAKDDIWDTQETPLRRSPRLLDRKDWTPLTPPTSYEAQPKKSFFGKATESPLALTVTKTSSSARTTTSILDEAELENTLDDEEDFKPRKLFRNCTDDLNAIIAELDVSRAKLRLSPHPAFGFADNGIIPTPSNRRSTETLGNISSKDYRTSPQIKVECTTVESTQVKIETSSIPQPPQSSSKFLTKTLEYIIPVEIHARLKDSPGKCVATFVTNPHAKCRSNARGGAANVKKALASISRAFERTEYTACVECIKKLVGLVTCGTHFNVATAATQMPKLPKLQEVVSNLTEATEDEVLGFKMWIRIISKLEMPNIEQSVSTSTIAMNVSTRRSTKNSVLATETTKTETETAVSISVAAQSVSIRGFNSYQPGWSRGLSVSAALLSKISEPLKKTDLKTGFIYIFWDKETFGMVKIGRTDNLQRRLKEWNRKCKVNHTYHAATAAGQLVQIPHVSRVEYLMHIELKDLRKERRCNGCGKMHKEWFQTSDLHAVKVFQKWQQWIEQEPYQVDVHGKTGFIKPEMQKTLAEVCVPVPQAPVPKPSPRRNRESISNNRRISTNKPIVG